jgi:broad specificity phosphatase PhoE
MSNNRIIFLRHADTKKDPSINASQWGLSEEGQLEAENIAVLDEMLGIDVIYTSDEPKTILTVTPLAKRLNKDPHTLSAFNEVQRGDKFLTKEEFELEKKKQLEDLTYKAFDGESGLEALARFKQGVSQVVGENPNREILVVTHGTVLNIYFADLLADINNLSDRWSRTRFCAVGIVEDGKVVRDII